MLAKSSLARLKSISFTATAKWNAGHKVLVAKQFCSTSNSGGSGVGGVLSKARLGVAAGGSGRGRCSAVLQGVQGKRSLMTQTGKLIETHPFISQVLIATVKTSIADVVVQMVVEKKKFSDIDWRRNLLFTTFGCIYLGAAGYLFYVKVFGRIFGVKEMAKFCNQGWRAKLKNTAGLKIMGAQLAADALILQPVFYWPTFYIFKESLMSDSEDAVEGESFTAVLERFVARYTNTFWEDNFGMTYFWVPANVIIFSVPLHLRMPLTHFFSFSWCMILSFWRGAEKDGNAEEVEEVAPKLVVVPVTEDS